MAHTVAGNVDYRRVNTGHRPGSCDNGLSPLSACVAELVADMHTVCWDAMRRATRGTGLVAEYAVGGLVAVPLMQAWRSVTCPVCSDTWTLSGPSLSPDSVVIVRRGLLALAVGL